jgi:putative transposase
MTRRRHTPEQIVRKLREVDRLLGEGAEVPEVAKALEVCDATYHPCSSARRASRAVAAR